MVAKCADDDGCDVLILVVFKRQFLGSNSTNNAAFHWVHQGPAKGEMFEWRCRFTGHFGYILQDGYPQSGSKWLNPTQKHFEVKHTYICIYYKYIYIYTYVLILLQGWKHVESLMPTWRTAHNKRQLERLHALPGLGSQVMQEWTAINCGTCEPWMSEFTKIDWRFSKDPLAPINQ